jgi:hypothetical protein
MSDTPGLSEQYRRSSPWPLFIAVGLAISEVGIVFPILPLAIGGLLLFVGSVGGILTEAGYLSHPWRFNGGAGGFLSIVGVGLWVLGNGTLVLRGKALVFTGSICLIASFVITTVDTSY